MEASPRFLEPERGQLGRRRGHVPQISISDDSHHVTEAIGDMYGDSDWNNRPTSFAVSPPPDERHNAKISYFESSSIGSTGESPLSRSHSNEKRLGKANGSPTEGRPRQPSIGSSKGSSSPPPRLSRTNSADTANQPFPLNDIDYESSPAAVAQELSNLQAIRRMSMNVDVADPDLPSFGSAVNVPSMAPSHSAGEDDASRMFWVPARLHPELAPTEFKTFVEDRVDRIRRRSGEETTLSPDGSERRRSSSSLSRRKSMLSKTIDSPIGWEDGADVLERKRSKSSQSALDMSETTLQELEQLVSDPTELVRKMSIDSSRYSIESGRPESMTDEDIPILPTAPGTQSLKRSTRTAYRRGSLKKGERVAGSRRLAQRIGEGDLEEQTPTSPTSPTTPSTTSGRLVDQIPDFPISRVQTEPSLPSQETSDSFSQGTRKARTPASLQSRISSEESSNTRPPSEPTQQSPPPKQFQSRIATNGRTTAPLSGYILPQSVPQIVETPPHESWQATQPPPFNHVQNLPERKSSHEYSRQAAMYNRSQERPPSVRQTVSRGSTSSNASKTLDDMANSPSLVPGINTRTDALSFIPTFNPTEEKKPDKKSKERRNSNDSSASSRKTSWAWLLGSQNQDSEKEKKDKDDKESSKKSKSKSKHAADKSHDSTRLDVLSTAADGSRGRESLVLDRESVKLEDERKKESNRRTATGEPKKERETGLFSALFSGVKKKGDRDTSSRKPEKERRLSPEPPPKVLRADIDYNWTRFSILEERAIYRMAHIKLANPRRALYSQVLLSNFMYSYLAKVQQMHPQIQIPQQYTQQKQGQSQVQDQQEPESDEYSQWQRYQEQQEYLSMPSQGDGTMHLSGSSHPGFIDDFDPEHQQHEDSQQQYIHTVNGNDGNMYGQLDSGWGHVDMYSQQGTYGNTRPPEQGHQW